MKTEIKYIGNLHKYATLRAEFPNTPYGDLDGNKFRTVETARAFYEERRNKKLVNKVKIIVEVA